MSDLDFAALAQIGGRIGERLMARAEMIAVADGATGGLISAALLATPGASAFFVGGGIVYSMAGRRIVLNHEPGSLRGFNSATEEYALAQARLIRARYSSDWGIAETGAAGPGTHPRGVASGTSAVGVVGPGVEMSALVRTGTDDRIANMFAFARNGLVLLEKALAAD